MTAPVLLAEAWAALGGDPARLPAVRFTGPDGTLPATLPVTALAQATAGAAALAAGELVAARGAAWPGATVDSRAAAVAFTSERHLRRDGVPIGAGFAELSGFFPVADGWVRTHGNYPHHRDRLLAVLGVDPDRADATTVAAALAGRSAAELEDAAAQRGALVSAVREPGKWRAHPHARAVAATPLVGSHRAGAAGRSLATTTAARPAAGVRVLDLTRVIAGPVAGRTLSLLGADVLRVDPPTLPELAGQHLDTGFGKRSTLLDLRRPADREAFQALLSSADVLLTGYRPGSLDRFGLAPGALAERYPGLVVARLTAWGDTGPWRDRRGFDSLVQAASGIARVEEPDPHVRPGRLPAQALDHATGYLMAAAVLRALAERQAGAGGAAITLALARTAAWLLDHAGTPGSPAAEFETRDWLAVIDSPDGQYACAGPPFRLDGGPGGWDRPPVPWGSSPPRW